MQGPSRRAKSVITLSAATGEAIFCSWSIPGGIMEMKPDAGSSRREKLIVRNDADIRRYMNSAKGKRDAARAAERGPDPTAEDLGEIPGLTERELAELRRLYRPRKERISIFVDVDVLAWLRGGEGKYQTRLNALLREAMEAESRRVRAQRARQEHVAWQKGRRPAEGKRKPRRLEKATGVKLAGARAQVNGRKAIPKEREKSEIS
jgi:uncharacterized protein (DUF4415 family)